MLTKRKFNEVVGRQTLYIITGILFACLLCSINLSMLAKMTIISTSSGSSGSGSSVSSFLDGIPDITAPAAAGGKEYNSCLRARNDTIPRHSYGNLTLPFINLGFPKMGTSSIQSFFGCAGYRSLHYRCDSTTLCSECISQSAKEANGGGEPPLQKCKEADAYSQLEGPIPPNKLDLYFPQIERLEDFVKGYPHATFLLPFRNVERWYKSVTNWPPQPSSKKDPRHVTLKDRMEMSNITGLPPGKGGTLEDLTDFFCGHVRNVREVVPRDRLVEFDIEDPNVASWMAEVFDLDEGCWGHSNVNVEIHPEVGNDGGGGGGGVPWFIMGKTMLRGKNGRMRRRRDGLLTLPLANSSGGMGIPDKVPSSSMDSCQELNAHENGYWYHHAPSENNNHALVLNDDQQKMYYPEEMMWLKGQNQPPKGFGKCTLSNKFLMYNKMLGHQCGCGVKGYAPSHSTWVYNKTNNAADVKPVKPTAGTPTPATKQQNNPPTNGPNPYYYARSPTLRLAKKLANANATLCFSGDSIDYQIYSAFHNNLRRIAQIHRLHFPDEHKRGGDLVSVVTREIPVKHATKPGNVDDWFMYGHRPQDGDDSFLHAIRPPPHGFGSIYSILETKAFFRNEQSTGTGTKARIRYYMSYGWSPWNVDFMEDCSVIIMNLGLHYHPDGNHTDKKARHPLMDDMLAAITYLSNFTASKDNRIAVWRSALPQHFPTTDGHFYGWKKMQKDSCSVIDKRNSGIQQIYNTVYDEAFSKLCQPRQQIGEKAEQLCHHHSHRCDVNPLGDVGYQTIYNFWRTNNCTEQMKRERLRLVNWNGIKEKHVTGTIIRWNIFNLFDQTKWHSQDLDCSHFCYIPPLFEAAFERLELLISPLLASF